MRGNLDRSAVSSTRARVVVAIVAAVLFGGGAARADQKEEASKQPPPDSTVLQVCVARAVLTVTSADGEGASPAAQPTTYRLTGPRGLVKQLKAHDGHYEEVTGRVSGAFVAPGGRQVGKIGGVGIVVGAGPSTQPNAPRVPEMPSFEVKAFRHLADRCPG
jgi:hypothetical protein